MEVGIQLQLKNESNKYIEYLTLILYHLSIETFPQHVKWIALLDTCRERWQLLH